MESLTQPQFIAFLFTIGVPIIALVWNQIKTNKKLVDSDKKLHDMLTAQQERYEDVVRIQQERHEEIQRTQEERHQEIMRIQERREEMLRVTLNSVEQHIQESNKDHAVLMDRTGVKS
ncbi:hypothetical protein F4Z99_19250 [Candidatus Poribacteria bacterium]|nr:hypothetical protein [Candidatus Poribacteria bacterium]MYB00387.1 hypothetical protein [Candidatus Poribacteria bacterium]